MNWKLIFLLSLFGMAMAFATVFSVSSRVEPFCWLPVFIACACFIAKNVRRKFFLHGFLVSMVNCIWIIIIHIELSSSYLAHHTKEARQFAKMTQSGVSLNFAITMVTLFNSALSGVFLGLFSIIASKFVYSTRLNKRKS